MIKLRVGSNNYQGICPGNVQWSECIITLYPVLSRTGTYRIAEFLYQGSLGPGLLPDGRHK